MDSKQVQNHRVEIDMPNIEEMKNLYKGKHCFVIGSAPGLKEVDVCLLRDRDTFAFNRSYIAWKDWGFAPNHYCVIDLRVMNSIQDDVKGLIESMTCDTYHFYRNEKKSRFDGEGVHNYDLRDGWGFEPENMYYCGDVAAFSLQVAYRLGYNKAYVIGVDLIWPERSGLVIDDGFRRVGGRDNDVEHFRQDYYPAGMEYSRPYPEAHYKSWQQSIEDTKDYDFEILSCSPGSRLNELVDYVDFKDLFTEK